MTKRREGVEPGIIGDHAQHSKSEDLLIDDGGCPQGLTQIFSITWSGPYLGSLGAFPDISDRVLEARIWHPKGLLPSAILPQEEVGLVKSDPWLRELVCRIQVVDYDRILGKYIYFVRIFVKIPEASDQRLEAESPGSRPQIEAANIRPDLGRFSDVDDNGVRGQARGLVPKPVLERLDGTENYGANRNVDSSRGPQVEFQIYPCSPGFKIPGDFRPPQLEGLSAACMEGLKGIFFRNVKSVERSLHSLYVPIRSSAPTFNPDETKRFTYSTYKLPDKLTFCKKVKVIARDDDALKPSLNGALFAKVAPRHDTESFTSTENLHDIQSDTSATSLNDTQSDTSATSLNDTQSDTSTSEQSDMETVTATLCALEPLVVDVRESSSLTSDISDAVSDKSEAAVKLPGKRIHSFLTSLFCCTSKDGEKYTDSEGCKIDQ